MSEKEDRKIKRNCKDIKDKIGIDGMSRKRIGLLLGQPDESYQKEFIDGFLEQTFAYDYDVCIFAMYRKYQETTNREIGESGIFSLIPYENFDGFVVLADTIQTTGLIERLEDELHTFFRGQSFAMSRTENKKTLHKPSKEGNTNVKNKQWMVICYEKKWNSRISTAETICDCRGNRSDCSSGDNDAL